MLLVADNIRITNKRIERAVNELNPAPIQEMDIISVVRTLPDLLGFDVSTIAGLSNLTSGQGDKEKKRLLGSVYLPMCLPHQD